MLKHVARGLAVMLALAGCGSKPSKPVLPGPDAAVFTVPGERPTESTAPDSVPCPGGEARRVRGQARSIRVLGMSGRAAVAPREIQTAREITLSCVRWRGWGRAEASGQGVARILECSPTCANGRIVRHRARIRLKLLRRCPKGVRYYSKADVTILDETGTDRPASYLNRACA